MANRYIIFDFLDEVRSGMALATEKRTNMIADVMQGQTCFLTLEYQQYHTSTIKKMYDMGRLNPEVKVLNFFEYYSRKSAPTEFSEHSKFSSETSLVEEGLKHYLDERPNTLGYRYYDAEGDYKKYKLFNEQGTLIFIDYQNENLQRTHRVEFSEKGKRIREIRYNLDTNKPVIEKHYNINEDCYMSIWINSEGKKTKCVFHDPLFKAYNTIEQAYVEWLNNLIEDQSIVMLDELNLLPTFRKIKNNVLKVVTLHNTHLDRPYVKGAPLRRVYKEIFDYRSEFKAIVFLTDEQRRDVEELYGKNDNFFVIPHAANPSVFKKFSFPSKRNWHSAITLARLEDSKNIADAIKAFSIVTKSIPDAEYHIFGYGKEKNNLVQLINYFNLEKNVFIHDFTHDVNTELQKHGCSIMTSRFEGFCLSIMESLANKTPVICYRTKYGPETLVRDEVDGYLVEYGNVDQLANKITSYMLDKSVQQRFSENSISVLDRFNFDSYASKWVGLLKSL
jgi:glycosyltransferase involved in cell wall biosynthesis